VFLSRFTLKKQIKVIYEEKEVNSQEIKKKFFTSSLIQVLALGLNQCYME
jgi:hypothetical protein